MPETPQIAQTMYALANIEATAANWAQPLGLAQPGAGNLVGRLLNDAPDDRYVQEALKDLPQYKQPEKKVMATTRLVKVFIADPNESLPLNMRLLYRGEEKITDLTDQELFYEIDIKGILESHNAARVKVVDKATKSREKPEMLEPARVRDLRMQVIVLAQF